MKCDRCLIEEDPDFPGLPENIKKDYYAWVVRKEYEAEPRLNLCIYCVYDLVEDLIHMHDWEGREAIINMVHRKKAQEKKWKEERRARYPEPGSRYNDWDKW